jgi:hypothetical protein
MALEKKMKTGFNKLIFAICLLGFSIPAYAAGTLVATYVLGMVVVGTTTLTIAGMVTAFAINLIISSVVSKLLAPSAGDFGGGVGGFGATPDVGNRTQIPPATDNKLPIVYGTAWVGGTITDLSITENNQELYYVLAICEVTSTNAGQTPDAITFGDIYYGGKKVIFTDSTSSNVTGLLDESTGVTDTAVSGRIQIWLYPNGSNTPARGTGSAIEVMSNLDLVYRWNADKKMTNCAFAIVKLTYSQTANIRGIEQTKFQVTNSRTNTGDCFFDYLVNDRYGCAIPENQIDTVSLTELTAYSNESFAYTDSLGVPATQPRFKFNGVIETNRGCLDNLQDMSTCCDCLVKYNEVQAKWGVIVQKPTYTVAMNINDSNMISGLTINPMDISSSYNVIECKFPDENNQDAFNTATFDLAEIAPSLLYPNEPVNKFSLALPLVNNDVQAQYIANRVLESAREDLNVTVEINYIGLELEAGDIVTMTSVNYGWVNKLFRLTKITQTFNDDGGIIVKLQMSEFNPSVYDDKDITQFQPSPNTGIGDPTTFGNVPAPVVSVQFATATNPSFLVNVTTSQAGIIQYAEVWYSAYANPLQEQMYFAGTSEIQSNGTPWQPNTFLPPITLTSIPAGNWYLFSRMVNSLASSAYSPASALLRWRPSTFQYTSRYLAVAYADNIEGTSNFSFVTTNRVYYGLCNQDSITPPTDPALYTWYLAEPAFGTNVFLGFINRTGRKFSFDTGFAGYASGNGTFVLTQASLFDPTIWSALPNGTNIIDLDQRTGQLIQSGTTSVGTGEIDVTNNQDGKLVASLKPYLDFGGAYQFTSPVSTLTVDIYGRIVGFAPPDNFYYSEELFTATASQTVFSVTRSSGYIINNCWVMQNGVLLDDSEFTDTGGATGTVTLTNPASAGDIITITSFRSSNVTTGDYASFSRNEIDVVNVSSIDCTGLFTLTSGYELIFINGTILNELDYNIVGQIITDFPSTLTGKVVVYQWTPNNLGTPNGNPVNIAFNTPVGQTQYFFNYDPDAFNLFQNGVHLKQGTDFTTGTGVYTLTNSPDTILNIMVNQTFARTGAV